MHEHSNETQFQHHNECNLEKVLYDISTFAQVCFCCVVSLSSKDDQPSAENADSRQREFSS